MGSRAKKNAWIRQNARWLAKHPTPAEEAFKQILYGMDLDFEFNCVLGARHYGKMIVDFYVPKYGVVFEIDGYGHLGASQLNKDVKRTMCLENREIYAYHIFNDNVIGKEDEVRDWIVKCISNAAEKRFRRKYPRF